MTPHEKAAITAAVSRIKSRGLRATPLNETEARISCPMCMDTWAVVLARYARLPDEEIACPACSVDQIREAV